MLVFSMEGSSNPTRRRHCGSPQLEGETAPGYQAPQITGQQGGTGSSGVAWVSGSATQQGWGKGNLLGTPSCSHAQWEI